MRLEITGRQFAITPAARKLVERGIGHTLRLLHDSVISAHVVLTRQRGFVRAEVTVHVSREHFFHGEGSGSDLQAALTAATAKIEHQAEKLKGKWAGRKRRDGAARSRAKPVDGAVAPVADEGGGQRIIRAKRYAVKPMSIEDAAAEIGDARDAVIVFRNASTDAVTVLYRRTDGNLGLIEPDA
ncbi:MAG TPA: ribosome-associated translation inhibitor RaiA [Vicinamibacterales bacterium]|jgi:putative sigma-54 modulation protein